MPKLIIDDIRIEYDIVDCSNNVIVLSIPANLSKPQKDAIKQAEQYIKDNCNAKAVVSIPEYVSFKTRTIDKTINLINRLIIKLEADKKNLLRMRGKKNAYHT